MEKPEQLLLLYDHADRELARDVAEFLSALGLQVHRIEAQADRGLTLDAKEEEYLAAARAVLFLLTLGCERNGLLYPSPSVTHEMGQAKQLFSGRTKKAIYLVDSRCSLPAIDQKARREFAAESPGSVFRACGHVVTDLVEGQLITLHPPTASPTTVAAPPSEEEIWTRLPVVLMSALLTISSRANGLILRDSLAGALSLPGGHPNSPTCGHPELRHLS